jgi:isopenicillin N synthase-like dioxygenase
MSRSRPFRHRHRRHRQEQPVRARRRCRDASAAEGIGFFYIRNTTVPQALIDRVLDISRRFFAAAPDAKASVTVNAGHRGFIRVGEAKMTENAQPDLKESFIWGLDTPGEDGIPPNRWPDFLPEMRSVLTTFFTVGNAVGWSLLRAVATALDISPDGFTHDRSSHQPRVDHLLPGATSIGRPLRGVQPYRLWLPDPALPGRHRRPVARTGMANGWPRHRSKAVSS